MLDWYNHEARSKRGDLYRIIQLSTNVWIVHFNGIQIGNWCSTEQEAREGAKLHADMLQEL